MKVSHYILANESTYLDIWMVLLQIVVQRGYEGTRSFTQMHRLKGFADIFNHRESGNALEKFGESLCHKLASDLIFQVIQNMLCRVPVPSVGAPLIDLIIVEF